jgi:hypothetical protein
MCLDLRRSEQDLGKSKAEVYQRRYDNFRKNLKLEKKYIDRSSAADLEGVTFAFVCVDKGSARAEIFELLISLGIPFMDVGMGANARRDSAACILFALQISRIPYVWCVRFSPSLLSAPMSIDFGRRREK